MALLIIFFIWCTKFNFFQGSPDVHLVEQKQREVDIMKAKLSPEDKLQFDNDMAHETFVLEGGLEDTEEEVQ